MTAGAQQLIPRRDLHEDREISPWRNWHANQRKGQVEDVKTLFVQPEPVVIAARLPTLELHHEFDALRCARRGDAEQILNVDDPESTNLHVMARRSEEHTSELQSLAYLVCRLLLEKKKI